MVVIETKSQILEMSTHEIGLGPYNNNHNASIRNSQHFICTQSVEDNVRMTGYINVGYMRLKPLLYPCTIEFSLMCLTVRIFLFNKSKTKR